MCEKCVEKEAINVNLCKKLDEKKRQLAAAQAKIKALSSNVINELAKQLEGKIKEVEMLKEMLRSTKIELTGKDKQMQRLKAKLSTSITSRRKLPKAPQIERETSKDPPVSLRRAASKSSRQDDGKHDHTILYL